MALKITDFRVNGDDLTKLGIPKGPEIGNILKQLLELVLDDPMLNTKERLLEKVKELKKA